MTFSMREQVLKGAPSFDCYPRRPKVALLLEILPAFVPTPRQAVLSPRRIVPFSEVSNTGMGFFKDFSF
ncbi:hypothetical protein WN55_03500 [Dufourea novaeangliae]|uniref:Uncharacterized protein n=1 Tax=Dufourea novaeangliae TaxID=178035 RepID=A0A154PJG2_DUFNO|nr:hypothetical protein WN55_03500 [Dufourea novaeangliae]